MSGLRRMTSFSKPLARCALSVALSFLWCAFFAHAALAQTSSSTHKHAAADPEAQALNRLLGDAQSAVDRQDYETAAQDYQDYLAKKPDDAEVHFNLGYVYTAMQRPDDAKVEYEKAIELAPDDPKMAPAYQNLGLTLLPKDPAAAVDPLQHAAELAPQDARTKWLLGMALENSGKLAPAIEQYQAAEKLNEKDFDTRLSLAHALIAAGRPADAEPELREALALRPDGPDTPRVHLELARVPDLAKKGRAGGGRARDISSVASRRRCKAPRPCLAAHRPLEIRRCAYRARPRRKRQARDPPRPSVALAHLLPREALGRLDTRAAESGGSRAEGRQHSGATRRSLPHEEGLPGRGSHADRCLRSETRGA